MVPAPIHPLDTKGRPIILVGLMGCGKTTVGKALSKRTGMPLLDTDAIIEEQIGCPIPEIFASEGEGAFRALEREITAEVGKLSGKIILTGGGVVKDRRNYASLHQNGRIYHLVRDLNALPTDGRPLSQTTNLSVMWVEREPLYTAFRDAVIDNNGPVNETAEAIWRDFCENSGA